MLNVDEIWNVHDDKEEDENVLHKAKLQITRVSFARYEIQNARKIRRKQAIQSHLFISWQCVRLRVLCRTLFYHFIIMSFS